MDVSAWSHRGLVGLAALAAASALAPGAEEARAQPQIPATFYGTASIDGRVPPSGTDVRAFIDGIDCTQLGPSGRFVVEGGVGKYVVSVLHESQREGCGREGRIVTFTISGQAAAQSGTWKASPQNINLNAGSGTPAPLPTSTAVPAAAATSSGGSNGGPLATASAGGGAAAATATIAGYGTARADDGVTGGVRPLGTATHVPVTSVPFPEPDGSNVLPIVLLVLAGVGLAGGVGGGILVRRKR